MKNPTTALVAIAIVGAVSLGAIAPALANGPRDGQKMGARGGFPAPGMMCSQNSADRFETMLGRVAERVELTGEQTEAFQAFKSSALGALTSVSAVCAENKPDGTGDLMDRLASAQALMAARLDAFEQVMPSLETFYDSLSDEQKAQIRPENFGQRRGMRGGSSGGQMGMGAKLMGPHPAFDGSDGSVNIIIHNDADDN